jgi:hypothetical protein
MDQLFLKKYLDNLGRKFFFTKREKLYKFVISQLNMEG